MTTCQICIEHPGSHSFTKLYETDDYTYYYTCPAAASRYNDLKGIINHYELELSSLNGRSWVWVQDSKRNTLSN